MYDRLKKYSKNGNTIFAGDLYIEEPLQIDFAKLNILHEKLNTNLLEYFARKN